MQYSRKKSRPSPDVVPRREPLVLGYEGTLRPDPDFQPMPSAEANEPHWIPSLSLDPWLESASRALCHRISAESLGKNGEHFDLGAWIDALRRRLIGILTQVVARFPEITEHQIWHRFPVLSALLKNEVAEWVDSVAVFYRRLYSDVPRLASWIGYQSLPDLASISPANADLHEGAQSVVRLIFRDGLCLYYKPRPVTGEWLWERLIHEVNGHSSLQLPSARTLLGADGKYGWVASLPHGGIQDWDKNSAEASRYWQVAGATLCLAEHLRMTDLHMANVMATCSGPALFDTETLGTPQAASATPAKHTAETPLATTINDLLSTGLLPWLTSAGLPDTSGLFGKAVAVAQIMVPRWSSCPDGTHLLEMAPAALVEQGNAPYSTSPLEVLPLLVSGYREAATALMRCRENILASGSAWLWTLERLHVPRIILRDTLTYCLVLSRSLQPTLLERTQRRGAALRRALREISHPSFPPALVRAETEALLRLHVPRFTALPGSQTLAGNSGQALAPHFLSCTPAESVLRKMGALTPALLTEVQIPSLLAIAFRLSGSSLPVGLRLDR
jgi:lantibiotic modifying enzyme